MARLRDLGAILERRVGRADEAANELVKVAMLAMAADLIEVTTPVDTSAAISNWVATLDEPVDGGAFLPPYVPGKKGSTKGASAAEAMAAVEAVVALKKPGQTIYLSNVTPYIVFLNDGTTRTAPLGFKERALQIGRLVLGRGGL